MACPRQGTAVLWGGHDDYKSCLWVSENFNVKENFASNKDSLFIFLFEASFFGFDSLSTSSFCLLLLRFEKITFDSIVSSWFLHDISQVYNIRRLLNVMNHTGKAIRFFRNTFHFHLNHSRESAELLLFFVVVSWQKIQSKFWFSRLIYRFWILFLLTMCSSQIFKVPDAVISQFRSLEMCLN